MATNTESDSKVAGLERLADSIERLDPPPPGAAGSREQILRTVRGYLIPRLVRPNQPLTVVFAGPTGAGKSTLINSVAAADLTATGPLRPTTRVPVVFAAADHLTSYQRLGGVECTVVAGRAPILAELTLVDTPDIDTTARAHRAMAEAVIDVADIVIFVSSALRYADRVPWEVLRRAKSRGASLVCVLNRIRSDSTGALADYGRLLAEEGLAEPVLGIGEHHLSSRAFAIPSGSIRDLRKRLLQVTRAHHETASDAWRKVFVATCQQASDFVDRTDELVNEALVAATRISDLLGRGRLPRLQTYPLGGFPPESSWPTTDWGRWRLSRWSRRHLPRDGALGRERQRLIETLVATHESHLAEAVRHVGGVAGLSPIEYETLRFGIERWVHRPLDESSLGGRSPSPTIDLLVKICAVSSPGWAARLIDLTVSGASSAMIQRAGLALDDELGRSYSGLEARILETVAPPVSPLGVEAAREAVAGALARFSFADA